MCLKQEALLGRVACMSILVDRIPESGGICQLGLRPQAPDHLGGHKGCSEGVEAAQGHTPDKVDIVFTMKLHDWVALSSLFFFCLQVSLHVSTLRFRATLSSNCIVQNGNPLFCCHCYFSALCLNPLLLVLLCYTLLE